MGSYGKEVMVYMISIIIPALNEEHYLPKLLKSIKNQTFKGEYEVFVADGGSDDKTREIAKSFGCRIVEGGGPAKGRNHGAKQAKYNYLLFLDSDVILPKTFLEKALKEFEARYLAAAVPEFMPLSDDKIDKVLHDAANFFIKGTQYIHPHGGGFCILCTKRIFERVGGFDETLKLAEDHDFLCKVAKLGRFRVLKKTKIYVSVRRLEKEGRWNLVKKYVSAEVYRLIRGRISEDIFKYEFGNHCKDDVRSKIPRKKPGKGIMSVLKRSKKGIF